MPANRLDSMYSPRTMPLECGENFNASRIALDRRRAVGVEGLDGFQPPCLPLFALLFRPDDRFPVRCQDQPRAGIGDLDPVAAGLIDVKKESLLDRMLMRTGFDIDPVLQKNVRGPQNILAAVERISEMVETARRSGMVTRIRKV